MSPVRSGKLANGIYLVDLRGWMCPYPKYILRPLLKKLPAAARQLVMMVDCPSAINDVPKEARDMGHGASEVKQVANGEWQIVIEIGDNR